MAGLYLFKTLEEEGLCFSVRQPQAIDTNCRYAR
jgi:hypothetical protein